MDMLIPVVKSLSIIPAPARSQSGENEETMKKILLTKEEEAAVRATRKVWIKKSKLFKAGKRGAEILDNGGECALCDLVDGPCADCPYYRIMGSVCFGPRGHYYKWISDPTLRTCKSIVNFLSKMLENSTLLREKKRK